MAPTPSTDAGIEPTNSSENGRRSSSAAGSTPAKEDPPAAHCLSLRHILFPMKYELQKHNRGTWTCVYATQIPETSVLLLLRRSRQTGDKQPAYYGIWRRSVVSHRGRESTTEYAFGPSSPGPKYFIRCVEGEGASKCGKCVFRVLRAWIEHCETKGCACDLVHIIGRDDKKFRDGYRVREVATGNPVRIRREPGAECTSGSLRAEFWAWIHRWRCACGCLAEYTGSAQKLPEARMVDPPYWFVLQPVESVLKAVNEASERMNKKRLERLAKKKAIRSDVDDDDDQRSLPDSSPDAAVSGDPTNVVHIRCPT